MWLFLALCYGAVIMNQRDAHIKKETDSTAGPFGAARTPLFVQPADHLLFALRRKRKDSRTFQIVRGAGKIIRTGPDGDSEKYHVLHFRPRHPPPDLFG